MGDQDGLEKPAEACLGCKRRRLHHSPIHLGSGQPERLPGSAMPAPPHGDGAEEGRQMAPSGPLHSQEVERSRPEPSRGMGQERMLR